MSENQPRHGTENYNRTLGRLRVLAVLLLIAVLVVLARPTPLTVQIGFVFVLAGEAMRFWAAGHLRKTVELITSGPYRYTRNPLYLGRLLIFTGLAVMARLPWGLNWIVLGLGYLVFFGYYLPRKERVEPARLREWHGETYERYFEAVPALFPTLTPYAGASSSGWSSERMLRNREHWMVVGLLAVSLFLALAGLRPAALAVAVEKDLVRPDLPADERRAVPHHRRDLVLATPLDDEKNTIRSPPVGFQLPDRLHPSRTPAQVVGVAGPPPPQPVAAQIVARPYVPEHGLREKAR